MKKSILLICLIISILVCSGCGVVRPTVLTIGGEEVSLTEYNFYYSTAKLQAEQTVSADQLEMYWSTEKDGKTTFEIMKDSAYEEMVNLRVAAKKAENLGLSYNDPVVMQTASGFKSQFLQIAPSEKEFYELTDTDSATLNEIAKLYAIRSAMISKLGEEGAIDLSEEAYNNTFSSKWMKAQHILLSTKDNATNEDLSAEEKNAKKEKAEEILKRVKKGEDFTKLMNEFSEDPGKESSPEGYVFTDGEMVAEFEDAVKALEPGKTSEIVESSFGYHIIKRLPLSSETDAEAFEKNFSSIQSELVMNYLNENLPKWKEEMEIVENKAPIEKIKL